MVVPIYEALETHLAVAHALAPVWMNGTAGMPGEVYTGLVRWNKEDYPPSTAREHLEDLKNRLGPCIGPPAKAALDKAAISGQQLLDDMFVAVANRVYSLYGALADTAINFKVLAINHAPYPNDPARECANGAVAVFSRDPEGGGGPTVKLSIFPSLFGPPSLASVPYLLCHELVCHAFQRPKLQNDDPFAEGWMDCVALSLHDAWSGDLYPQEEQLARAEAHNLSRSLRENWELLGQNSPTLAGIRRERFKGWFAAELVKRWLEPFETTSRPTRFERLSIEMNQVDLSVIQREAFVSAVNASKNDDRLKGMLSARLRAWVGEVVDAPAVLTFASAAL